MGLKKPTKQPWINLSAEMEFTDQAYEDFYPGRILIFTFEGSKTYLKVKRVDKVKKKIWAQEVRTYSVEEFETMTGGRIEEQKTD